jgi:S-adenosylmethionine:tRNA ribosyltransferase-isomerase
LIPDDFDYDLPPDRIAQEPLPERDASRLMVLPRTGGLPTDHLFSELPDQLQPGDLLVANRSRVLPARLLGRRPGGGGAEVLLLGGLVPHGPGEATAEAFVRPGRRLREGDVVVVDQDLTVRIESGAEGLDGRRRVRLRSRQGGIVEAVEKAGHVPLPPYIRRPDRPADRLRYQTVYAREAGSIAAPTAGLHFTDRLLDRLRSQSVGWAEIVLHVGPGTFRPITARTIEEHRVEAERYEIPPPAAMAIDGVRQRRGRVIAVGTTVVRALETATREDGTVSAGSGRTDLVIHPGFRFRAVDGLVTNFHLPRSSLLLLVAAFGGRERILAAYAEAVRRGYRFYSYGDAMLMA